nr:MAG TPA: NADH-ubiquinone oxidoreductase 11 kDa subunit [Caudoviricetes sp.]
MRRVCLYCIRYILICGVGKPFGFWHSEKPVATGFAKGLLILY